MEATARGLLTVTCHYHNYHYFIKLRCWWWYPPDGGRQWWWPSDRPRWPAASARGGGRRISKLRWLLLGLCCDVYIRRWWSVLDWSLVLDYITSGSAVFGPISNGFFQRKGGIPPSPLNGKSVAEKLTGRGGTSLGVPRQHCRLSIWMVNTNTAQVITK